MIEILLMTALSAKMPSPPPPPQPLPIENTVGLPSKRVELQDDKRWKQLGTFPVAETEQPEDNVQKRTNAPAGKNDYNRRGIRNH